MKVEELISVLKQFPKDLPVIVFNSEGEEIMVIPENIPEVGVGVQTINGKEITLILTNRKVKNEIKFVQENKTNRGICDPKDSGVKSANTNNDSGRDYNRNSKRRRRH